MALYRITGNNSNNVTLNVDVAEIDSLRNEVNVHETRLDVLEAGGGGGGGVTLPISISDVADLANQLSGKSPTAHTHAMTDVTGLVNGLALKIDKSFDINYTKNVKVVYINSDGTADYTTLSAAVTALFNINLSTETDSNADKEIYSRYRIVVNSNTTEPGTEINVDRPGAEIELVGAGSQRTINTTNSIFFRNCKVIVNNLIVNNTGPKITSEPTVWTSYGIRNTPANVCLGFLSCHAVKIMNTVTQGGDHGVVASSGTNLYLEGTNQFLYTARPLLIEINSSAINKGTLTCAQENGTSNRSFLYSSGAISVLSASTFYSNGNVTLKDCYIGIRFDVASTGVITGTFNIINFSGAGMNFDSLSGGLFGDIVIDGVSGGSEKIGVNAHGGAVLFIFNTAIKNTYLPWHSGSGSVIEIFNNITDTGTTGSYSATTDSYGASYILKIGGANFYRSKSGNVYLV